MYTSSAPRFGNTTSFLDWRLFVIDHTSNPVTQRFKRSCALGVKPGVVSSRTSFLDWRLFVIDHTFNPVTQRFKRSCAPGVGGRRPWRATRRGVVALSSRFSRRCGVVSSNKPAKLRGSVTVMRCSLAHRLGDGTSLSAETRLTSNNRPAPVCVS